MRRKRKNRGIWMPNTGVVQGDDDGSFYDSSWVSDPGQQPPTGYAEPSSITVKPLTFDFTQEPIDANQAGNNFSLRDLTEGQDWLCQRIVGKFHAGYFYGGTTTEEDFLYVKVALGIFVARSKDDIEAEPDLETDEMDPFAGDNIMDSWMFRRTWMFANKNQTGLNPAGPSTTMEYGTALDGPHVDVKSKRRITREHRLWAVVASRGWSPGYNPQHLSDPSQGQVQWTFDYRIHGMMKPGRNNKAATL